MEWSRFNELMALGAFLVTISFIIFLIFFGFVTSVIETWWEGRKRRKECRE